MNLAKINIQFKNLKIADLPNWLRSQFTDGQRFLILCILTGFICGLVAVFFHLTISAVFDFVWTLADNTTTLGFVLIMIFVPTLGGLITGIVLFKIAPSSAGSGIPQTKAAYHLDFGELKFRDAVYRFIIGSISVGSGLSLGREGPTVHICATIASSLGRLFGLAKKRVQAMVPVGMGAGIAAAFNTPISAFFFVFEELLGDFSSKALFGIMVAVVIAATVERICLGEHPAFELFLPEYQTDWWMLICIFLGIASALLGNLFVKLLLDARAYFKEMNRVPVWVRPAIGGFFVSILGLSVYFITSKFGEGKNGVFAIGYKDLSEALNGKLVILGILIPLLIGKFAATILAYASGCSGGVFAPALFIGGMFGAIVGVVGQFIFGYDPSVIGAIALLGMGSFFAAVIRCPLTSIMIIFEMTQNYALILPLMFGNIISFMIASKLRAVPLYDALLQQDKISIKKLPLYKGDQDWRNLPISTIATWDITTVHADKSAHENIEYIAENNHHAYPVVDSEKKLIGVITHHELQETTRETPEKLARYLIKDQKIISMHPQISIRDAAQKLVVEDVLQAPITSEKDNTKLLGIVTLHDIARQQNAIDQGLER